MAARTACRSLLRAQRRNLSTSTARASSSSASPASPASPSSSSASSASASAEASTSASWQPLLKPGVLPAYDEALAFLSSHSASLRNRLARMDDDHPDLSADDKAALRESLEIAAAINEPSVLAAFQASSPTAYDAGNAAFRHLRERVWRHDSGVLSKVVERCTLMRVLPDVVPAVTPLADVQLSFGQGDGFTDHVTNGGDVLVGAFVPPSASVEPPRVDVNVFHTEPKQYTLALVDPDQPDAEAQQFKTSLLALKTNVTLSATSPHVDLTNDMAASYIPPHPQQGTKFHRCTMLLLEQSAPVTPGAVERHDFDVRAFVAQHGLTPVGIHFWRSNWSTHDAETVSRIYADVLRTPEPKYTKPPTLDKVRKQIGDIGSKWF